MRPDFCVALMTGLLGFHCISSRAAMSHNVTNPLLCTLGNVTFLW